MPIEWNDSLKTGINIIDEQHQELVVMLNRLGRFKCGVEYFNEALAELEDYVNIHFKTEKHYMKSLNYPHYKEHKAAHDGFVNVFLGFKSKIKMTDDCNELGEEIIEVTGNWLMNHYTKEDVELAAYIKQSNNI